VADLLEADSIYVVSETIKSRKFTVDAQAGGEIEAAVDVPEIQEIVGAKVNVSASGSRSSKLTYESVEPLVFGFQAIRLYYDQGRYTAFEPLPSGGIAARDLESLLPQGVHVFESEGTFARLD
jgi:hypothetical protein